MPFVERRITTAMHLPAGYFAGEAIKVYRSQFSYQLKPN